MIDFVSDGRVFLKLGWISGERLGLRGAAAVDKKRVAVVAAIISS